MPEMGAQGQFYPVPSPRARRALRPTRNQATDMLIKISATSMVSFTELVPI
jgi:hypothetical protein